MSQLIDKPPAQAPQLKGKGKTPLFALPSTAGGTSGPGALRSKYNAVLAFLDAGPQAEEFLCGLAAPYPEILASQARLLVVVPLTLEEADELVRKLSLPFPLLADDGGKTTRRMLGESNRAALCVTDRYGQVFSLEVGTSTSELPPPRSAFDWLEFILIQCPE
ncbi:MAG: redoxin domain-containing protein [Chloroflexota bacterium]|nr:redoxin domain-containing protein [Chloroflexota bacterium]MDQ5865006.1 redoxin domain-containing protein [Chloroflexota bacterium]